MNIEKLKKINPKIIFYVSLVVLVLFIIGLGFNFGTVISIGLVVLFVVLYKKEKLKSHEILITSAFVILVVSYFSISFFKPGKSKSPNNIKDIEIQEIVETDNSKTAELIKDIMEHANIEKYEITKEDVTWTAQNVALGLNQGRKAEINQSFNWNDIELYFSDWSTETIGFTYVAKDGTSSKGYMGPNGAMCIVYYGESTFKCGFGPGGPSD